MTSQWGALLTSLAFLAIPSLLLAGILTRGWMKGTATLLFASLAVLTGSACWLLYSIFLKGEGIEAEGILFFVIGFFPAHFVAAVMVGALTLRQARQRLLSLQHRVLIAVAC